MERFIYCAVIVKSITDSPENRTEYLSDSFPYCERTTS